VNDLRKRAGWFEISWFIIEREPETARLALAGCVVIRAEMLIHTASVRYVALHEDFDVVEDHYCAPQYECQIMRHEGMLCTRSFVRVGDGKTPVPVS
jgi:hypothetical protein